MCYKVKRGMFQLRVLFVLSMFLLTVPGSVAETNTLDAVREALTDELYELAEKQLREYLAGSEKADLEHEARAMLSEALYGKQAYTAILELLESSDAKSAVKPAPDGSSVYWRAMARFGLQQYEAIGDYLSDFETRYPGSPYRRDMLRLRGLALHKAGKTADAKAFAAFDEVDKTSDEAPANLLSWGLALIAIDQPEEAEKVLKR